MHTCVYLSGSVSHLKLVNLILTFALLCVHHWKKNQFLLNFLPSKRKLFGDRRQFYYKSKIKSSFLWDAHLIHGRINLCGNVSRANHRFIVLPLHLKNIYLLCAHTSVHFWQQKVQKDTKWIAVRVHTLSYQSFFSFYCKVRVNSALTWHEQTGSAENRDHPSPGFSGLISEFH